ncbi:MAG TPA: hypothetical protein VGL91_20010 [Acidobacteriota bacterium]
MPFFELADIPERIGHRVDRANDAEAQRVRRVEGMGDGKRARKD